MPGAALPMLCCHAMRGVTFASSCGSGPGLRLPPVSQANEGAGIHVIHDVSGDSDSDAQPTQSTAATTTAPAARCARNVIWKLRRPLSRLLISPVLPSRVLPSPLPLSPLLLSPTRLSP